MSRHSFAGAPAQTALTGSIGPSDVTLPVATTSGWPNTAIGEFVIVVDPGATNEEKLLCSAYTSTSISVVTRGYDGTSASSHDPGAVGQVVPCLDATQFDLHDAFVAGNGSVTPSTSAIGDAASDGVSFYSAAADHVHGRETFATGATSASAPADTEADGSSIAPARADHRHARESIATLVTDLTPGLLGQPLGLTGATAATRYVGATASGAPASGTFATGDFVIDQSGAVWVCTAGGSPGVWTGLTPAPSGAWTTYTPTWTASSSNPSLGNGTLVGTYQKIGRQVAVRIYLLGGSTTTVGTGFYSFALPVAPVASNEQVLSCDFYDGADHYGATALMAGTTLINVFSLKNGTGGKMVALGSTSFSAGIGAIISAQGIYESAT